MDTYSLNHFFSNAALGQVMLYVDGMEGVIRHNATVQWLYSLLASKVLTLTGFFLKNSHIGTHHSYHNISIALFLLCILWDSTQLRSEQSFMLSSDSLLYHFF